MAVETSIWDAIKTTIDSYSTSLPIARPNVNFTPPDNGLWLEVMFFPNGNNNITWLGEKEYIGQLTIGVSGYKGTGIDAFLDEAEAIKSLFTDATVLGPVKVEGEPEIQAPIAEEQRIYVPVNISYRGVT